MGILSRFFSRADTAPAPSRRDGTSEVILPGGLVATSGGFGNPFSGLGIPGQDPSAVTTYHAGHVPTPPLVERLYTFDWLAQRVIEKMPQVAMVRGFTVEGQKDGGKELIRKFQALNTTERFPRGAFERAVFDGRAYGGAVLLIGYAKGNPRTPLTDQQKAGGINFLDVFRQDELRILQRYEDPNRADFGMPSLYEVINVGSGQPHPRVGQIFHASRSIRFSGLPLRVPFAHIFVNDSTGTLSWPEAGVSVLTPVLQVLAQYGIAWSAVSNMLQDSSIGWMKISGLIESLASEDEALIKNRLQVLQQTKGTHRMFWLDSDAGEEYGRTEVSLTDIPAVLQQYIVAVSGAADVPARIFFGTSPQGLNANSSNEGDLIQLYNTCQDYQNRDLGPKLETILTAVNGGKPVEVEWPSLWESSDNEQAQTRLANANATKVLWDMGVMEASDIVEGAKTGVLPETLGKPDDNRILLKTGEAGGDPGDPMGNAGTAPDAKPPQGAPGKQQAATIAKKQRAADAIPTWDEMAALVHRILKTDFADFDACVVHMQEVEGYSKDSATKICGYIAAHKGK